MERRLLLSELFLSFLPNYFYICIRFSFDGTEESQSEDASLLKAVRALNGNSDVSKNTLNVGFNHCGKLLVFIQNLKFYL